MLETATKDLINGGVGWQSTIEDCKLSLQSLWDVVSPTTRMNHGSLNHYIHNSGEVSRFV